MRCLIRTVPWNDERYLWARELSTQLPGSELVEDDTHDAYDTFVKALEAQGSDDVWHLEDDAVLTSDWERKALSATFLAPRTLIQGFNYTQGAEGGLRGVGTFWYGLCFLLPGGWAQNMHEFATTWQPEDDNYKLARFNFEIMIRSWMRRQGLRTYFQLVPSLVQHRQEARSMVNPGVRQNKARQSPDFEP